MFTDKIAVVTGASGVIGKEVTKQLAENGAKITLVGTSQEKLDNTVVYDTLKVVLPNNWLIGLGK